MPKQAADPTNIHRQRSEKFCGRLTVLEAQNGLGGLDAPYGAVTIAFPAMPDAIELVRRADYVVSSPIGFPDGIHMYKGTAPLEIPISFKLHAFDQEYCPNGVKTLLQIAANLEALTLPFGDSKIARIAGTAAEKGQPNDQSHAALRQGSATSSVTFNEPANIYPPATCYLELITTEPNSVGIVCVGYVKEVKARLVGPFLRGPGSSQNLPIHGEFEFTFVHHPGHGNNWTIKANQDHGFKEQQAYAQVVQKRLYNTRSLSTNMNNFHGFND